MPPTLLSGIDSIGSQVPLPSVQATVARDSSYRRQQVGCRICGRPVELARMRDHLRAEHQVDSSTLERQYLDARIEARRARRTRP